MKEFNKEWLLSRDETFRYQMLDRLRCDCEYYLGYGLKRAQYLWAGDENDQIELMKALWNSFPEDGKPEWLTWTQIENYAAAMCSRNK